ncbi:MAG: hypothetical protein LUH15_12540 [Tannerellaceae bacterium]|nr:hypothetical protein [Tannerellaceae bacterium]
MNIPIENIYYLLCYAWNNLEEREQVPVAAGKCGTPLELLARILINGSKVLLKRGIDHNYCETEGEVNGVKGKLLLTDTFKKNLFFHQRTCCRYNEFSANILSNRIWISTLRQLIATESLHTSLKEELIFLVRMLPPVTPLRITLRHFEQVQFNRNNRLYKFVLNVCRLIHENLLPIEESGGYRFIDFTRDERKMAVLFEAFVRNFYQLEQRKYSVCRERLNWHFTVSDKYDYQYLPKMITDITLENEEKKIIIDTKYYKQTLATNFDVEKIHSANLYQLFSYLMNPKEDSEKARQATGILLYPTIDKEYNLSYFYQQHPIYIKTINLNTHWTCIAERLQEIIHIN